MTDTAIFAFPRAADDVVNIRSIMLDGEPWFVDMDVCRALGLRDHKGSYSHHISTAALTDGERRSTPRSELGERGGVAMVTVSESGLYKLILRSNKPEVPAFQHWIASEVLPSIRKTGKYALADHGREAMPLPMDIAESFAVVLERMDAEAKH